ncbi:MAG TPA: NADH-quinone oxidoreductase subunit C [Streptomyces sp.]|nr:NADH-quinone oxidoreductase subunit C [Streptomyces sp.]
MTAVGWLPDAADVLFGAGAEAEEAYGLLTVDVPAENWVPALTAARDELGCTYFDWLSAVDEPGVGFRVCAHLVALPAQSAGVRRLVVRTTVPHDAATLPTATGVYAGAAWHERETHEMFGLGFTGHPGLDPLLLPDGFEGHPLRKDFVLAARVVKAWPGAKEPGESGHGGGGRRRQMRPPGVPDPNEWGPQAGRTPPPEEPPRRARSASAGSASQRAGGDDTAPPPEAAAPTRPRRSRSAGEGSASQRAESPAEPRAGGPRRARSASGGSASQRAQGAPDSGGESPAADSRRTRSASGGSASQRAEEAASAREPGAGGTGAPAERRPGGPRRARSASGGSASQRAEGAAAEGTGPEGAGGSEAGPRSADAPWHHARPAFDDEERDSDGGDDERGEA